MNAKPSYGPTRSPKIRVVARVCATMVVIMLVAQLYTYEDFAIVLGSVLPFSDQPLTQITAALFVVAELLALPYLLGMYMSKLMRLLSACVGGLVAGTWLIISLTNAHAVNSALFSTALEVPGGILPVVWSFVMFAVYITVVSADSKFRHDTTS